MLQDVLDIVLLLDRAELVGGRRDGEDHDIVPAIAVRVAERVLGLRAYLHSLGNARFHHGFPFR